MIFIISLYSKDKSYVFWQFWWRGGFQLVWKESKALSPLRGAVSSLSFGQIYIASRPARRGLTTMDHYIYHDLYIMIYLDVTTTTTTHPSSTLQPSTAKGKSLFVRSTRFCCKWYLIFSTWIQGVWWSWWEGLYVLDA